MIMEQTTCNSLNAFTEWFFAGFTRIIGTPTNEADRSEVYDVSIFRHLMAKPDLILTSGSEKSCLRKSCLRKTSSSISRGQSIFLLNAMLFVCYEHHRRRTIRYLFLSATGSSFTTFFSNTARLEPGCLHFSPADFATEYVY
jgi:hypothetical protein